MLESNEDLQALLNLAYFFLKFRPRTKKEVRDYLLKKIKKRHFSQDQVFAALKELEEQGLINDQEFLKWFVEQRSKSKPKSQFALKRELRRFGIDQKFIDEYFTDNLINEEELAHKALLPRWERFGDLDSKKRFQKSAQFLLRRGFSYEIIRRVIDKFEEGKE